MMFQTHIQPATLRALGNFIGDSEGRVALNGILFDCQGKELSIVATDSRRLVIHKPEWEHTDAKIQFILPAFILPMLPEKNARSVWEIAFETTSQQIRIVTDDFTISCRAVDAKFPSYKEIVPDPLPTTFPAHALNANLGFLTSVFALINFLHGNSAHVEPVWDGYGTPVVFEFSDTRILLMPALPTKKK